MICAVQERIPMEYSRDGQIWFDLSSSNLEQLGQYLAAFPFTRKRLAQWDFQLVCRQQIRLFPGTDFEVCIRAKDCL
jgi:hypothetical protein